MGQTKELLTSLFDLLVVKTRLVYKTDLIWLLYEVVDTVAKF